ncbi:MAG: hypothetical protein M1837_001559 [Sclerophora amabilis]|nr:MAG: hypothetical protein M1837_001559 [Sclerophora amabilis]
MEPLVLKPRQAVEEEIDCWDDDGDLQGDFELRDRDDAETDDVFSDAGGLPDIKSPKGRPSISSIPPTDPPGTSVNDAITDDFEQDLQFPDDGEPLKLSTRKEMPKTPITAQDDFDEWAEGSLGTRYGGTKRDGRSHRSSSLSGMSPSISSSFTAESEDEGLDGLVLPDGPLQLDDALKKRQKTLSSGPADLAGEAPAARPAPAKDDFFAGIDIGDGDVFDSGKQTLNRNVRQKKWQSNDPTRPVGLAMMFSNRPALPTTRIPRPAAPYERAKPTLEPVSESGGPLPSSRRPRAGTGGHSAQSSTSSTGMPSTPSSTQSATPSTPSQQRDLNSRPSMRTLRDQPTTTGSQLLKMKRSLPIIRAAPPPLAKPTPSSHHRPATKADSGSKANIPSRPKTPVDRTGAESSLGHSRKPPVPFLPAGTNNSHSHHISAKSSRTFRRWDSSESNASSEQLPYNRPGSRLARSSRANLRSPSPSRRKDLAPEALAREAAAKRTLTRPTKTRRFGDGSELELIDDLPTSAGIESKFTKAPNGRGAPKSMRLKLGQQVNAPASERSETPMPPATPLGQTRHDFTPRFARDTNASRNAREQRVASNSGGPLAQMSTNWKAQIAARGGMSTPATPRSKRRHAGGQQKPHLIKPLGDTHMNPKSLKGMHYNPTLYRWEGNENALAEFNTAPVTNTATGGTTTTPKPALITNLHTASPTVQVVGGMVFDPQRMRWLKLSQHQKDQKDIRLSTGGGSIGSPNSASGGGRGANDDDAASVDSDDPFADVPDLDDRPVSSSHRTSGKNINTSDEGTTNIKGQSGRNISATTNAPPTPGAMGSTQDEWLVGEEFDVGPEFIRRQREEEDRWRRKVGRWISGGGRTSEDATEASSANRLSGNLSKGREEWRWAIRNLALGSDSGSNGAAAQY